MSVNSRNGKFSLETFTIDHNSQAKTNDEIAGYHEPERGIMSVLTINRIDKTDENLYKCSMTNPFGTDYAFTQLVVQEPPTPPNDVKLNDIKSKSVRVAWKVISRNIETISSSSNEVDATSNLLDDPPITEYIIQYTHVSIPWTPFEDQSTQQTKEAIEKKSEIGATKPQLYKINSIVTSMEEFQRSVGGITLDRLFPFQRYKIRVAARNALGVGPFSADKMFRTLGDKPEGQPQSLEASSPASTFIFLKWKDPPKIHWNGKLFGYRAGWREISLYSDAEYYGQNKSISTSGLSTKEVNFLNQKEFSKASFGIEGTNFRRYNWTDIERVDSTDLQAKLKDLKPYTQYEILLQAFNQYGRGPVAKIEAFTAGDIPSSYPKNIKCDCLSQKGTSLEISWTKLTPIEARGKLVSVNIIYQNVDVFRPVQDTNGGKKKMSIKGDHQDSMKSTGWRYGNQKSTLEFEDTQHFTLDNLAPFSNYSIILSAETEEGEGPFSPPVFCSTQKKDPGAPDTIKITPSAFDRNGVIVSWLKPIPPLSMSISNTNESDKQKKVNKIKSYILYKRYKPPSSDDLQTENIQIASPKSSENTMVHKVIRGLKPGVYYQFWVSAVNSLNNEGPTSIVQGYRHERRRNADLEASRVRVVSIGHDIFLRKHEQITLFCEYGISVDSKQHRKAEKSLERQWFKGSKKLGSKRERYLIQNVQEGDSGNYSCVVTSTDKMYKESITYQLFVVGAPKMQPKLKILDFNTNSFSLKIETGQLDGIGQSPNLISTSDFSDENNPKIQNVNTILPLITCSIHYKPRYGKWMELIYPAKNLRLITLRSLPCGRPHDLFAKCSNIIGVSPESLRIEGHKTLGEKPQNPMIVSSLIDGKQPGEVVHPSNSSVRFDLYRWSDSHCPVDYFVISYKKTMVINYYNIIITYNVLFK